MGAAPGLEQKYQKYKDRGYEFVAIYTNWGMGDSLENAKTKWVDRFNLTHLVIADTDGKLGQEIFGLSLPWNFMPQAKLLGPKMVIEIEGPDTYVSSAQIEAVLPN